MVREVGSFAGPQHRPEFEVQARLQSIPQVKRPRTQTAMNVGIRLCKAMLEEIAYIVTVALTTLRSLHQEGTAQWMHAQNGDFRKERGGRGIHKPEVIWGREGKSR